MSLRWRLIGSSLLTLAVGLGALLVFGNALLAVRESAENTALLRARAEAQLSTLSVTADGIEIQPSNDAGLDRQSWVFEGGRALERPAEVPVEVDRAAMRLARGGRVAEREIPDDVRLRAVPVLAPGTRTVVGAVVVGLSVASVERLQKEVLVGSAVLALLVLTAGFLATRAAVDGALRPVARMTRDAESWSARDLEGRFDLGTPHDELTALAATLDGLLARIAASRRHEQHFASEVAHELRTPLAAIRGRAELAIDPAAPDDPAQIALRSVLTGADRMGHTITTLIAIARSELDPSTGSVDLVGLIEELDDVRVVLPPAPVAPVAPVEGDPDVVRRALAPLVDNARRHATSLVTVELRAEGAYVAVLVCDDGPGLDPALGDRAFEPGVRGTGPEGAGLGLPLARRLARSCGGDVVARPGPGGCFALRLPVVRGQATVRT